jgi:hypothetical protein
MVVLDGMLVMMVTMLHQTLTVSHLKTRSSPYAMVKNLLTHGV